MTTAMIRAYVAAGITLAACGGKSTSTHPENTGMDEAWSYAQFGTESGDFAAAIAVDESGSLYVAGYTAGSLDGVTAGSHDGYVRKYGPGGEHEWTEQFGTGSGDECQSVAVDVSGNVYVAGDTSGSLGAANAGSTDGFLRKHDSSGTRQWTNQFGTATQDFGFEVAVDASGNVYVAGSTDGSLGGTSAGQTDGFLRKVDASGGEQWTEQFGTSVSDFVHGIGVDTDGNVYVAGATWGSFGGTNAGYVDGFVRKYDSSGAEQWTAQFGTPGFDWGDAVAVDQSGNVYVTGHTDGSLGGANAGGYDAYVSRFDSDGAHRWTKGFGTAPTDESLAVAVDDEGNVYVAGSTWGSLGGVNAGEADAFAEKYDSAGRHEWTVQFGTAIEDLGRAVAVDASENLYVAGGTQGVIGGPNAGSFDAFIVKVQGQDGGPSR